MIHNFRHVSTTQSTVPSVSHTMNDLYRPHANNEPWGPIISPNFHDPPSTNSDVLISSIPFALMLVNFVIAIWQGYNQTKAARDPFRSSYVWMIWLSMMACFALGLLAYLHVLRYVPSSKFFRYICWRCTEKLQVSLFILGIVSRYPVSLFHGLFADILSGLLGLPSYVCVPDYHQSY